MSCAVFCYGPLHCIPPTFSIKFLAAPDRMTDIVHPAIIPPMRTGSVSEVHLGQLWREPIIQLSVRWCNSSSMAWVITGVCSRHPGYPWAPLFCTLWSVNSLARKLDVSLFAVMDQNIFLSSLETGQVRLSLFLSNKAILS